MENNYCSIFVAGDLNLEKFKKEISGFLGLKDVSYSSFEKDLYEIDIIQNSDFNDILQYQFPDGFLYFQFKMEIDFKEIAQANYPINLIGEILEWLWGKGISAVASCDYEDKLPMSGGYKNPSLPWPKIR